MLAYADGYTLNLAAAFLLKVLPYLHLFCFFGLPDLTVHLSNTFSPIITNIFTSFKISKFCIIILNQLSVIYVLASFLERFFLFDNLSIISFLSFSDPAFFQIFYLKNILRSFVFLSSAIFCILSL
jgi:hypothetical protein